MRKTWAASVGIALDQDGDVPIGVQLDWTLRAAIAAGRLRPGERLPGLREVAEELGISHTTLRAAVARLEADGLLETRHGAGTFVAKRADEGGAARAAFAGDTAARARAAGIAPRELAAALYVEAEAPVAARAEGSGAPSDEDAAERRALREELAVLDRVLVALEERLPERLPGGGREWKPRGARLLTTAELREQRDAVIGRIADAQRALEAAGDDEAEASPGAEPAEPAADARRGARRGGVRRPGTAPA